MDPQARINDKEYLVIGVEDGWIKVSPQIWSLYMTYKELLIEMQKTWNLLDQIDITIYIRNGDRIHDVMNRLMDRHGEEIFDCINEDDFIEYLQKRGIRCEEISYYRIIGL